MSNKQTVTIDSIQPRNKKLHDVLGSRKGGRMADRKKDFNRARSKGRGQNNFEKHQYGAFLFAI